jgi:ribosomal protein S17E
MGKIKSKVMRRTVSAMFSKGGEFAEDFERNKKILGSNTMPSKKLRNRIAGLISRLKVQERIKKEKLAVKKS